MLPQLVHFVSSKVSDPASLSKPVTSFQLQAVIRAMANISRADPELTEEILLRQPLYAVLRGKRYNSLQQAKRRRRSSKAAAESEKRAQKQVKSIVTPRQARHAAKVINLIFGHGRRDDLGQLHVMFDTILGPSQPFLDALGQTFRTEERQI